MELTTEIVLLGAALLLFSSIVLSKAGRRFGVPSLLVFLGVGMLFGSDGLGIQFNDPDSAQFIGVLALSIILFSGGMDTKFKDIKPIITPGLALSTVGVVITMLITAALVYFISHSFEATHALSIVESLLLAAVISSTDSASVFSILQDKNIELKENIRPMLELESGSNDPIAYMMTILLIQATQSTDGVNIIDSVITFIIQMSIGGLLGYGLGKLSLLTLNKINLRNKSLYPILLLSLAFFIYSFTSVAYGNGFLAVYIAGLVVGNHAFVQKKSITNFFDGFSWLFQIVMFLTLGLLVNPHELLPILGIGLAVGLAIIILARPIAVFITLLPFRGFSLKARTFVSWVGLRGASPIIFATYPLIAGVEHASFIFNMVFFITIISLLVQGTTIETFARLLKLIAPSKPNIEIGVELHDKIQVSRSEILITDTILDTGNKLKDLNLPPHTIAAIVKRDKKFFVPDGMTTLEPGDRVLVISDQKEDLQKVYKTLGIDNYAMD